MFRARMVAFHVLAIARGRCHTPRLAPQAEPPRRATTASSVRPGGTSGPYFVRGGTIDEQADETQASHLRARAHLPRRPPHRGRVARPGPRHGPLGAARPPV